LSAYISDIAAAVVTALNGPPSGEEFSQEFTAERVYVPESDYSGVTELQVKVFARAVERTNITRSRTAGIRKDLEVAVTIAQRIGTPTDPTNPAKCAELDDLMELANEFADYITSNGPYATYPILRLDIDPIYDFEILRTHRVFVTALRCFFFVA